MRHSPLIVSCKGCGKEFRTIPAIIRAGGGKFCSRKCTNKNYPRKDPLERFLKFVNKTPTCWIWTGSKRWGYGQFNLEWTEFPIGAHRASWILLKGPIPDGLWVLHHCDNRPCVNPDHLFLGDVKDNGHDAAKKGRLARKLTPEQVLKIKQELQNGIRQVDLAAKYGVSQPMISAIKVGISWSQYEPQVKFNVKIK